MSRKAALHNLGCKVNAYELDAMRQLLEENGYEIVPFEEKADLYLINTCTVTNIADRKSRQMLHKAKKQNPDAVVAAVGCYAQAKGEELEKDPAIDLVIGNNRKKDLIAILEETFSGKRPEDGTCDGDKAQVYVSDLRQNAEYENLQVETIVSHTRAFVKVQDGCNQFCSYCIIPYARGKARSRRTENVLTELQTLAEKGIKEVVLSGIHLSSYGIDLEPRTNLQELISAVHAIPGIERIRLGSLEPGIITEELAAALSAMPKVCPHFHLSLQSGCDKTLKRMNRHYTAEEYREKCRILRKYFDNPALTTDVITGFPGETEEDFAESAAFVKSISFYETHVFPYSRREGTRAAAFPDQNTEAVKKARVRVLLDLDHQNRKAYMESFLDKPVEVLIEEQISWQGCSYWQGYTREYQKTWIRSDQDLQNRILRVLPREMKGDALFCDMP